MIRRTVLALLMAPAALFAQNRSETANPSFTLETMMAAPFASDLIAAPNGRAVAWIGDESGKRNVWVAEAPLWPARRLTQYDEDDGQEIADLVWSADSRSLLFTRGGDSGGNWDRTVPANPESNPQGTEQAVFVVPLLSGKVRRLGQGHGPVPSPRGDQVVWLLRDTLRVAPLARAGAARILFKERGATDQPAWSPDGRRVAFTSRRRDHAFVGVYDVAADHILWVSPGTFRDDQPKWSPDGTKIAYIRRAGTSPAGSPPLPRISGDEAPPFTIRVADATSGQSREAWRSPNNQDGNLPPATGAWALMWAANDRLVFASEQTGWVGLYAVGADGGEATRLTPTGCEIEDVTMAPDRSSVMYASNCGDIDRRHVQRLQLTPGAVPVGVTGGPGIEWSPAFALGRTLVLRSDARHPVAPAIADSTGLTTLDNWPLPDGYPADQLVEPQQVLLRTSDSLEIHCQLFLPPGTPPGRMPAVIFFHGGPSREMLLGFHYMGYYHKAYTLNQYLASRGFIVLSVNYRGGIGYGRAFRDAPHRGRSGGSEYNDVLAAVQYLRGRPDVDTLHVGAWGGSYGGYLTSLALARNSDLFAAGFDLHGVHDYAEESGLTRASGASDSTIALARTSSAIGDVARWKSPVLLVAGDDDRNVHFSQTVDLATRLRREGVHVEELIFVDEIHDFLRWASWVKAYQEGVRFLVEQLRR